MTAISIQDIKDNIGREASLMVPDKAIVGLGTGSTTERFLIHLAERCRLGLDIKGVPTSQKTALLAQELGIPLANIEDVNRIDIAIDGADEIDIHGDMIKGGGAALLREKVIANASNTLIIIADESKLVERLGKFGLPIEIFPFGYKITFEAIEKLGHKPKLRCNQKGNPILSDNGNYIADLHFSRYIENPQRLHDQLDIIPGVAECGLFCNMYPTAVIGFCDGTIKITETKNSER